MPPRCPHQWLMKKSDTTLLVWRCQMCHSGPHWYIFECQRCRRKCCRPCTTKP
ncbi:hypothetical protein BDZ85DRAFT_194494 [Elsinoe ampelina]|uniref:Uncharacterized protein n=2 Tax=Elsinoe TaxID=40996 RepID=A0A8K0L0R6_9PEZI|nr:hypothetical protein BDZ85DRAFT_194494 [Elsinoe ampelina]KAG8627574.1 hypothetical protein KVT40_005057 [Elsinoe batatas]